MKKERYLSPKTCSIVELETEYLQTHSKMIMFEVEVDPLDEEGHYFDGTEETSDHLIIL